ncbi:MAG: S-methyl-5-thioribose-1-phosphate isomerase [Thermoprotei archaeon]|nr:MAG: S-methyl-5-thioribose-1-phosphate isomerase [Thermoprotei archaeon]
MNIKGISLSVRPIEWVDNKVRWLDTSKLPYEEVYYESADIERIAEAIERMEIRGAPAIGVAAALALATVAANSKAKDVETLFAELRKAKERLIKTRPTAVNLFWALNKVIMEAEKAKSEGLNKLRETVINTALNIMKNDIEMNISIGKYGAELISDGDTILTHCNAGALATAGFGTALGVIRYAWYQGKRIKVIATETRPVLQGARLTVWELKKEGIPVTLITDNMVGYIISRGMVNKVIVGADRILLSGHVINKIGTYMVALVASRHNIPFYIAAPTSTIDPKTHLDEVVIEERDPNEVRYIMGKLLITVPDVNVMNPAFDITPPDLVTSIITEKGIVYPPYSENLKKILST